MEDDVLGIRATIDASEVQKGADDFVQIITDMQSKTDVATHMMTQGLDNALNQIAEFGKTANGMSLSDLSTNLANAKAQFMSLSEEISQQRSIIADTTFELKDLKDAYSQAKEQGSDTGDLKQHIEEAQQAIASQKRELYELVEAQKQAKTNVDELSQSYKEAQSATPSFDGVVNGAQSAEERIAALRESFNNFQSSIEQSQQGINDLSSISADSQATGDEGQAEIIKTVATRYVVEGADETAEKTQLVNDKIDEVSKAYAQSTAAAQTAFSEQGNLVQALESQISNLQQIMQQAMKAGDMESATEVATQIQTLETQLTSAKDRLAELQQQAQQSKQSLSDFANNSTEIQAKVEEQSSAWGRLKDKVQRFGETAGSWLKSNTDKGKEAISSFGDAIDGMGIPIKSTIAGFGKMTAASLRFLATPLGAVLGAIVLALKAVHTYLNKSAEGQKIMAKVSAFLGSIMSSVTDIVIAFGKYFFKVISGSNSAANEFAKDFVTMFKGAFGVVKDLAVGFGTIFKGVWQIIKGEFSDGWQSIKDGALQMGTGIKDSITVVGDAIKATISGWKAVGSTIYGLFTDKDLANDLGKAVSGIIPNAKKAAEAAGENLKLSKESDEAKLRGVEIDTKVNDLKNKALQTSGKEKDELLKQAEILQKQKYYGRDIIDQKTGLKKHEDGILDVQRKQYNNLKLINGLHTKNLSQLKAERQARISLAETEAQSISSMRMLIRQREANQRKMASSAKSAAKSAAAAANKDVNRSNATTSAEDKLYQTENKNDLERLRDVLKAEEAIANAKIKGMKNGYERTRAEREKQNEDELQQIEKQRNDALEAEKKRQKAEFDAQQAIVKAKGGKIKKWDEKTMLNQEGINKINGLYDELVTVTETKQKRSTINELSKAYDKVETEREDKIDKLRSDIDSINELIANTQDKEEKKELEKLKNSAKEQLKWVEQNQDAWQQYINKYGTFLEKRAALDEKFAHDTLGLDESNPRYLALKQEHDAAKSTLESEELLKDFNWMDSVTDWAKISSVALEEVKQKLIDIINANKELNSQEKLKIIGKIDKIQSAQNSRKGNFFSGSVIGTAINNAAEKKRLKQDFELKKKLYEQEKEKYDASIDRLNEAKEQKSKTENELNIFLQSHGSKVSASQLQGMDMKQAMEVLQNSGVDTSKFGEGFGSMLQGFNGASQGAEAAAAQASQAATAMQGAGQAMQGAQAAMGGSGGGGANGAAIAEAIIKTVNKNVQSLNELVKKFGDEDSDFSKGMNDFADSSNEAVAAFDSFKEGDFMGVVLHLSNAFEKLGSSFAHFFGFDGGERAYKKELEHYQKLSGIWSDLIDKKSEYVNMSWGDGAKKAIKEVEALYAAEEKSNKAVLKTYLAKHATNAHSEGYRSNEYIGKNGGFSKWSSMAGVNISSIQDFYEKNYTYDQLVALKGADNGEFWGKLSKESREYIDNLIDCKKATEDFEQTALEKLTGVKFDDMYSNFMSALGDMSTSADDFVSDFKKKIRSAIIQNMYGDEIKKWMKDFTERYQKDVQANGGKISEAQKEGYITELQEFSNNMYEKARITSENLGLASTTEETSEKSGYATASEESIEELSGRALATNEALYSIRDQQLLDSSTLTELGTTLQNLVVIENSRSAYYDESIDIQRTSVSHLAAIEKNTHELFAVNQMLLKIEKNTRNM